MVTRDLDGVPQIYASPMELDLPAQEATLALRRAIRIFRRASCRMRKAQCWAYVMHELWNARQHAVRIGVLERGTETYNYVSAKYEQACSRYETARSMERSGIADART